MIEQLPPRAAQQPAPQPAPEPEVAISVRNIGKLYRIYERPQDRLKQMILWRFGRSYGREFWALRDISLEIRRGQTVGIIGRNGTGKSTLLQIIAGTLTPTEGEVAVRGRVAALLELGSGFNPEFTGRENVYLNAAILGLSREETDALYGEIAGFADIGEFIDQPTKTYSSGMVVRLAFAVAACVEPEVLIVDEALAVGDIAFQARCLDRIKQLQARGTTTLFVTHDTGTFQNLCDYGYLLDHGQIFTHGRPAQVAMQYYELMRTSEHTRQRLAASPAEETERVKAEAGVAEDTIRGKTAEGEYRFGAGGARITDYRVMNADGAEASALRVGEPFSVAVRVRFDQTVTGLSLGIMFRNAQGQNLLGMHSYHEHRIAFGRYEAGDEAEFICDQTMLLNPGDYLLSIGIADCRSDYDFSSLDSRSNLAKISVFGKAIGYGLVHTQPAFRAIGGLALDLLERPDSSDGLTRVRAAYEAMLERPDLRETIEAILQHGADGPPTPTSTEQEERAWPGEPRFRQIGYHKMMLGRYAFAGAQLCRAADVLDTACGLGWGAYLVAHFARHVTAFDIDAAAVAQCAELWPRDNIRWRTGDARDLSFLGEQRFDVALGMETIEHFSEADGAAYVRAVAGALRPGGVFIGTSAFPETQAEAEELRRTNPFHPHIFTRAEMLALLRQHFVEAAVIGGWMFLARK